MRLSDYLVEYLHSKGVDHFFGYQGTMISYFVDAIARANDVRNHSCYNEQGAAFAACGLAQSTNKLSVAYATSGPGAINLLSGVADAYFDSLPVLFITGQVNTYEYLGRQDIRQHAFQEADIVSMAKPVSKYAVKIDNPNRIRYEIEKAVWMATNGRPGSVLLDIPMDIQRAEIDPLSLEGFNPLKNEKPELPKKDFIDILQAALEKHERPVFILGNGVSRTSADLIEKVALRFKIPIVTTLLGKDLISSDSDVSFGYLGGAYGVRVANLISARKADLLVCFGVGLVTRQTGTNTKLFAPEATIIRFDIDPSTFGKKIGNELTDYCVDINEYATALNDIALTPFDSWFDVCKCCKKELINFDNSLDERAPNRFIESFAAFVPENSIIVSDVGQHMMWVAQSMPVKKGQKFLFSGGHGAMGYALPASIGASYDSSDLVFCFAGDGGFQMNIQELEWVAREQLPIKIIVLNNHSLGMIRVHQKMYLNEEFEGTSENYHYSACDFSKVISAFGIRSADITFSSDLSEYKKELTDNLPFALVVNISQDSYAYPKTVLGNPIYNQSPLFPQTELKKLISL